jgi:hypothetical protein
VGPGAAAVVEEAAVAAVAVRTIFDPSSLWFHNTIDISNITIVK